MLRRLGVFIGAATGAGLLVAALLSVAAPTPRGKSNVLLVSGVIFALVVLARSRRANAQDLSGRGASPAWSVLPALAAAVAGWSATTFHYFVADEFVHVYLARLPLGSLMRMMFLEGESGTFLRPAGFFTFWLDRQIWGDWVPGYHLTNLLLHLGVVAGVFAFCRTVPRLRSSAAWTALIFAVLPVHTEAVAWVGARFDLLAALSVIWAMTYYLRHRRDGSPVCYAAALGLALAAFFSKENAYMIPVMLLAAELFLTPERRLRPIWPFIGLLATVVVFRYQVLGGLGGYVTGSGESATTSIGFKTLEGLLVRAPSTTLLAFNWVQPGATVVLAATTVGILTALALASRPARGLVLFGFVWILLAAVPAHPLLLIGPALTNSRVLYLGGLGVAIVLTALLSSTRWPELRTPVFAAIVACLLFGAWHNTSAWRHAADLSQRFADDLREQAGQPEAGTALVFHDVPETIRGVYFMRVSIMQPVWLALGREDLGGYRATELEGDISPAIHFDWIGSSDRAIARR